MCFTYVIVDVFVLRKPCGFVLKGKVQVLF